jgi:hypothetical protein
MLRGLSPYFLLPRSTRPAEFTSSAQDFSPSLGLGDDRRLGPSVFDLDGNSGGGDCNLWVACKEEAMDGGGGKHAV